MSKLTTATRDIKPLSIDEWKQVAPVPGEPPAGHKAIEVRLADDRKAWLIVPEDGLRHEELPQVEALAKAVAKRNGKRMAGEAVSHHRTTAD
jgi:hypothetical protein